jgi:ABC-type transport system substrate-binding protein
MNRNHRKSLPGRFRPAAIALALSLLPTTFAAAQSTDLLTIATHAENQAMQAQQTYKEVNSPGLRNVIEQLTTVDLETGQLMPMLATSWEQVDPTTWRFQLREGVTFHDGSPLNGESAAFAVNWVWSRTTRSIFARPWARRSPLKRLTSTPSTS